MNLFLDSANFTDGFTNTSSTFAPSLDESYYYDNNTWPPFSTLTLAPVEYSSGSGGCLDNSCDENDLRYTRFIYGTLIVFFGIFLLLYCASQQSQEQDSNDDLRTTTAAANPGQARPPEGAPPSTQRRHSTNRNRLAAGGMSLSQRNQFITQFLPTKLFKASSSREKNSTIDGEQQASIEMKTLPPPKRMDFDSAIPYGDDDDDAQTDCAPEHHSQLESAARQELSIASLSVRECAVCLEAFCQNDEICTSNNPECSHVFHRDCMHSWLLRQEECPCCRRPYLKFDPTQEILL